MHVHTAIYGRHPASLLLAIESTNWPLIPKSHSFMFPLRSSRMLDGFTSVKTKRNYNFCEQKVH